VSATDASVTVQKVKTFVFALPKSELLGAAYQYQLHAFEQLNDLTECNGWRKGTGGRS